MSKNRVKVSIDSMNFYVVGEDDEKFVKELAQNLDDRIKEISNSNYKLNQVQTLILTALNILNEKEKAKRDEIEVDKLSKDENLYKENLKSLENLKNKNKELEDYILKAKENLSAAKEKTNSLEDRNLELKKEIDKKEEEISSLREELNTVKSEKNVLEEQIYESQKRIIDLNREIENLNESK